MHKYFESLAFARLFFILGYVALGYYDIINGGGGNMKWLNDKEFEFNIWSKAIDVKPSDKTVSEMNSFYELVLNTRSDDWIR